jgi:hypothetical protein
MSIEFIGYLIFITKNRRVGGKYRCANTSPTIVCGFTHALKSSRYHTPESVTRWTQWSPHCTWCSSCCDCGMALAVDLASARASGVARVMTLSPSFSCAPNGCFPHPARARGVGTAWPQTGHNKDSLVARSKIAMWQVPTSETCLLFNTLYK